MLSQRTLNNPRPFFVVHAVQPIVERTTEYMYPFDFRGEMITLYFVGKRVNNILLHV
jgi:hypothetical protein